jgi:Neutral trehalase
MKPIPFLALLFLVAAAAGAANVQTPAEIYGELFERVQLDHVYPDSKNFVDALPVSAPEQVLAEYRQARSRPDFDLRKFVAAHFTAPPQAGAEYHTVPGQDIREHIDALWKVLERKPEDQRPYSSRLALPHRYVVPGGRFNEIYYWDSYFTMLGLEQSGRHDLTVAMLDNFAWLIDQFGHVPNGNRSYTSAARSRRSSRRWWSSQPSATATRPTASTCPSCVASTNSGWKASARWRRAPRIVA